jgi:hypothetical protein
MFTFWGRGEAAVPASMPMPASPAAAVAPVVADSAICRDCGAAISGNYCANCGQETRIQTPTVRQFTHEMMDQYVAVEGKLGRTLRVLVTRPGQLTMDYIEGRRQRYVRPLKLYVSISVVFFGLLGILPDSISNPFIKVDGPALQKGVQELQNPQPGKPQNPAGNADKPQDGTGASPPAASAASAGPAAAPAASVPNPPAGQPPQATDLKTQIERDIDADLQSGRDSRLSETIKRDVDAEVRKHAPPRITGKPGFLAEKLADPEARERLRAKLLDDAPYAMFFLLPYFALLLSWLYRKNKQLYGVHLLFSVHLHCFAFLLLMLMLVPWQPWRQLMELVGAVYVYLALRRVYGGTWKRTLWRMGLLYVFYVAAIGATALSGVLGIVFGNGGT